MKSGGVIFWNAILSNMSTLGPLLCVLIGLACLKVALGNKLSPLRVRRKPLLTRIEAETLDYLETLFPQVRVHAQVAMSALIAPARGMSSRQTLWMHRRYGQKVIDFVLQDRASGDVRLLVELDDCTHNAAKDRKRDKITAAGGYRTVRLSGRARPTRQSVASAVGPVLDKRHECMSTFVSRR
jgi:hypothetical protein